eukprot:193171_1
MALRRRIIVIFLLLILVLLDVDQFHQSNILFREPYSANSIINLENVIAKPARVTNAIQYPRGFTERANLHNIDLTFDRIRPAQISIAQRLFRFNVIMTVGDFRNAAWMSDQHITSIYRDFHHVSEVLLHQLSPIYLYAPDPYSWEYDTLVGTGPFAAFPNCMFAADVVKFAIQSPQVDNRAFFDGHHWEYNMGMWVACDSSGVIRIALGPEPGSVNDITIFASSDLSNNLDTVLQDRHLILFDGIYHFYGHPFLTPFTEHHGHVITDRERLFNERQRHSRVIIEHVFGLVKIRFQILYHKYRLRRRTLGIIARCAFIMHNIIVLHQCPMGDYD